MGIGKPALPARPHPSSVSHRVCLPRLGSSPNEAGQVRSALFVRTTSISGARGCDPVQLRGIIRGVNSEFRWNYLMDMDGVLVSEESLVPGADAFISEMRENGISFMVLTNNSIYTPRDLRSRLHRTGLDIPESAIWTSALATARFLRQQRPGGSAYVVGESGLTTALHNIGYVLTDRDPDYVVLGETRTYSFEAITRAIRLVEGGARFIATNPDEKGPSREGSLPATGAVAALIERATGRAPYYIGKPNPLMMRSALRALGAHSENTLMIGDRMDTDVRSGLEAGLQTLLVLSGISGYDTADLFPYRPTRVLGSVGELVGSTLDPFGENGADCHAGRARSSE